MKLSEAKFSCLECGADNLVWPRDLESTKKLTGDEPRTEAMDFLRCKRCGGEVTISGEEERELFMSDRVLNKKTLNINKSRYEAIARVPNKVTICCANTKIVLESNDDEILGELAGTLVRAMEVSGEGSVTLEVPDSVSISLVIGD